ncbi:MAG: hypothetical protein K6G40_01335 [Eubacterium sp.]|nr:hypothetical protein [Eubacterium sp.]
MGLFSKIFGRFRKKDTYEETLEYDFKDKMRSYENSEVSGEQRVIEGCEKIMELVKDLKKEKSEYDVLTGYLNDTEILLNLAEEDKDDLAQTASNIINLSSTKDRYRMKSAQISDERMSEFDTVKDDMPDRINTIKSNEAYQNVVKRDMQHLEGEKHSWAIEISEITEEQSLLNKVLYIILFLFAAWMIICGIATLHYNIDMNLAALSVGAVIAVIVMLLYVRIQTNQKNLKQAEVNINRAIVLLNQMKAKYVTITNAVNYAYEKYDVKSSYELGYLWEQYLQAVREREAYERANEDLDYYNKVLLRELKTYKLFDESIWIYNAAALVDDKEMVEVRHRFIEQRQKCRSRIENVVADMKDEYQSINKIISSKSEIDPQVKEILSIVEALIKQYA